MTIPMYNKATLIVAYSVFISNFLVMLFFVIISLGAFGLMEPTPVLAVVFFLMLILEIIVVSYELVVKTLSGTVTIDDKGVTLTSKKKNCFIGWKNMKLTIYTTRLIIFTSRYDKKFLKHANYGQLSNVLIYIQRRPGISKEVRKYWNGTIIGERK